jgi:hypothetical protein
MARTMALFQSTVRCSLCSGSQEVEPGRRYSTLKKGNRCFLQCPNRQMSDRAAG